MRRTALLSILALTACSAPGGPYPSLQPRGAEAIDEYTEAARLRPECAEFFYNLAIAYFESGNLTMAASEARVLQKLDPKLYERYLRETM